MGQYYDVNTVKKEGIPISHYPMEKYPVGKFRNRLVAICDRMIFKQAADVTLPSEYALFYSQYRRGMLLSFDLYDFDPKEV
jgi:hypothetical protein